MRSLLPLAVCCISLVSLQPPDPARLDLLHELAAQREDTASGSETRTGLAAQREDTASGSETRTGLAAQREDTASGSETRTGLAAQMEDTASGSESRTGFAAPPPGVLSLRPASGVRVAPPSLTWARPAGMSSAEPRAPRARRHAHSGHHGNQHGQLMRVGCVLGTCQVQNLSHRLYQLIGQSGREEAAPVNPRSPHSYG
ncbi:protein ADM2a [Pseudoliparis swirei]|uniref:protein ADM2a n=1 Tax=Pseudoliparis swirei TaxID=2059687 RepID=UPI0024BDB087|nr:protein ADM2a [Pseudoliparis swirei]